MRGGIWVLTVFAAIWWVTGVIGAGLPLIAFAVPIAISAALIRSGLRASPASPSSVPDAHIGRLVGIWSAVEGVAMFVAANICINIGARDAIVPVFAIIVGLHFLPLARDIPVPLYYRTGFALVVLGAAAMFLPGPERMGVVGLTAAAILWVSCGALIRQTRAQAPG